MIEQVSHWPGLLNLGNAEKKMKLLIGKLWYMYESFRVDENTARCFTIHDLCATPLVDPRFFFAVEPLTKIKSLSKSVPGTFCCVTSVVVPQELQ